MILFYVCVAFILNFAILEFACNIQVKNKYVMRKRGNHIKERMFKV